LEDGRLKKGRITATLSTFVHQLNNILMGIEGNTSLLLLDKDAGDPDYDKLREIDELVKRGVALASNLPGIEAIHIPSAEDEGPVEPGPVTEGKRPEFMSSGSETILIADDEDMILKVCAKMLGALGYHVLSASSGKQAVEIFNDKAASIDLVMLDIVMPDMGGGEAYYRIKEIKPDIRVLLLSKYDIGGKAADLVNQSSDSFLQKPFNIEELSMKVRETLDH